MTDTLRDVLAAALFDADVPVLRDDTLTTIIAALAARNIVLADGDAPTPEPLREAAQAIVDWLDGPMLPSYASERRIRDLRAALAATESTDTLCGTCNHARSLHPAGPCRYFIPKINCHCTAFTESTDTRALDVCPDCGLTNIRIGNIHITAQRARLAASQPVTEEPR